MWYCGTVSMLFSVETDKDRKEDIPVEFFFTRIRQMELAWLICSQKTYIQVAWLLAESSISANSRIKWWAYSMRVVASWQNLRYIPARSHWCKSQLFAAHGAILCSQLSSNTAAAYTEIVWWRNWTLSMFPLLSKVFDGATISDISLGRFCNSALPPTLTSSQNVVLIHFHSDDVTDDSSRGFQLRVSGIEPGSFISFLLSFRLSLFLLSPSSSTAILSLRTISSPFPCFFFSFFYKVHGVPKASELSSPMSTR